MNCTRREWLATAGAASTCALIPRGVAAQSRSAAASPPPAVKIPATLPDRASFPGLSGLYMDSASRHPPHEGAEALRKSALLALAGEDGFRPDRDRVRGHFASLIKAHLEEIAYVPATQIGESLVAAALGLPAPGAHVVSDPLHFVGSLIMYTDMKKQGLEVTWVRPTHGRLRVEDYDRAIRKGKTRLVAISSTSMVNGTQPDIRAISEIAHARGAWVHVDAIQTIGNTPVDIEAWGADSLCAATYKWMMAPGTAFLYVRASSLSRLRKPIYHFEQYDYPHGGRIPDMHALPLDTPALEIVDHYWAKPGTQGVLGVGYEPEADVLAALEYGLSYLSGIGVARINAHNREITAALKGALATMGATLLTPPESTSPIVTIVYRDAEKVAPRLREAGVRVTTRWNTIRISPSVFNSVEEVDRILAALPRSS